MSVVRLDPESVEEVAQRVADLLRGETSATLDLIDAAEVARRLNVTRDYVYAHPEELGARRLGEGPKARLRFDPKRLEDASEAEAMPAQKQPKQSRRSSSAELLPVRGG